MSIDKELFKKNAELVFCIAIYLFLVSSAILTNDSLIALISAFCGITYTILAGKGLPICYLIGVCGSALYSFLAFHSSLWGNLVLYAGYYIPMQIIGFFQWNKNLKTNKKEIIKVNLAKKEKIILFSLTSIITFLTIAVLYYLGDQSPVIDGITTIFSILGMYLTVKRSIEQWVIWIFVNGLSLIMWLKIVMNGVKAYSTVIMWFVYFVLAIYFYFNWRREVNDSIT